MTRAFILAILAASHFTDKDPCPNPSLPVSSLKPNSPNWLINSIVSVSGTVVRPHRRRDQDCGRIKTSEVFIASEASADHRSCNPASRACQSLKPPRSDAGELETSEVSIDSVAMADHRSCNPASRACQSLKPPRSGAAALGNVPQAHPGNF